MASKEIQELKERLRKVISKRNAEALEKAKAQIAAQDKAHPCIKRDAESAACRAINITYACCSGGDFFWFAEREDFDLIADVLTYLDRVSYDKWEFARQLDPALPDERNLFRGIESIDCTAKKQMETFTREFDKAIKSLGMLAKNLKSAVLPKVIECLMRYDLYRAHAEGLTQEEARRFADELFHAHQYLAQEVSLYNDEEVKALCPPMPPDEVDDDSQYDDFHVDRNSKPLDVLVQEARERAKKRYAKNARKILPQNLNHDNPKLPKVMIYPLENLTAWADRLDGEFRQHRRHKDLPLDLGQRLDDIKDLLATDTILRYGVPKEEDSKFGGKIARLDPYFTDETPEHPKRVHIVECLVRYFKDGAQVASKLKSDSLALFQRMNEIYEGNQVDKVGFYFRENDKREMRELNEFYQLLVDSHRKIWADIEAHGGKFRLGKAPGRPAASLGKGPQTSVKESQRRAICREALQHPLGIARAKADDGLINRVWKEVGNKPGGYATKGAFARWFKGATIDKIKQYK